MTNSTAKKVAKLERLAEQGKLSAHGYRQLRELREYGRDAEDAQFDGASEIILF